MAKRYYWLFSLILVTAIVTVANGWIMKHRYEGFLQRAANYVTLYHLQDTSVIIGTDLISPGKLLVKLSYPKADQWLITPDVGEAYSVHNRFPIIDLLEKQHTYRIQPLLSVAPAPIVLEIKATPGRAGVNTSFGNYRIVSANIPIGGLSWLSMEDYIYKPSYFPERDVREAYASVLSKTGIDDTDSTAVKIQKLAVYLLDRLDRKRGQPTDAMYKISPYAQYQAALADRSGIWCTNYHQIYNFFANLLSIPTRRISVYSGVDAGGHDVEVHSFDESYIREKHQWAMVDLTSRNIFVTNAAGDFLNSVDLFHVNQNKSEEGLKATVYKDGQLIDLPYAMVSDFNRLYFSEYARILFDLPNERWESHLSKLYSYLFKPQYRYALEQNDWKYSIKQGSIIVQFVLMLVWLVIGLSYLLKRVRRKVYRGPEPAGIAESGRA